MALRGVRTFDKDLGEMNQALDVEVWFKVYLAEKVWAAKSLTHHGINILGTDVSCMLHTLRTRA